MKILKILLPALFTVLGTCAAWQAMNEWYKFEKCNTASVILSLSYSMVALIKAELIRNITKSK